MFLKHHERDCARSEPEHELRRRLEIMRASLTTHPEHVEAASVIGVIRRELARRRRVAAACRKPIPHPATRQPPEGEVGALCERLSRGFEEDAGEFTVVADKADLRAALAHLRRSQNT